MAMEAGSIKGTISLSYQQYMSVIERAKQASRELAASNAKTKQESQRLEKETADLAKRLTREVLAAQKQAQSAAAQAQKQAQAAQSASIKQHIKDINTLIKYEKQLATDRAKAFWGVSGQSTGLKTAIQDTQKLKTELVFMAANAAQASSVFYKMGNAFQVYGAFAGRGLADRIAQFYALRSAAVAAAKAQDLLTAKAAGIAIIPGGIGPSQAAAISAVTARYATMIKVAGGASAAIIGIGAAAIVAYKSLTPLVTKAIEFEDAFVNVEKTVDGTREQLQRLSDDLRLMATELPVKVIDLTEIASMGGQLGIATENLKSFTETIARFSVSANLTATEAASQFAAWANITKLPQEEIGKLASVVTLLGNQTRATEKDVLDFGLRIAGAGKVIGLTDGDIAGIAATLASLGLESEAAGTAYSRMFYKIYDASFKASGEIDIFASLAGKTTEAFKELLQSNPSQAFVEIVKGMSEFKNAGGNIIQLYNDLGIKDVRLRDSLSRSVSSWSMLQTNISNANAEMISANALNDESAKKFSATAQQITLLKNIVYEASLNLGQALKPAFDATLGSVIDFARKIQDATARIRVFFAVVKAVKENFDLFNMDSIINTAVLEEIGRMTQQETMYVKQTKEEIESLGDTSQQTIDKIKKAMDAFESSKAVEKAAKKAEQELERLKEQGGEWIKKLFPADAMSDELNKAFESISAAGFLDETVSDKLGAFMVEQFKEFPGAIEIAANSVSEFLTTVEKGAPGIENYYALLNSMREAYDELSRAASIADDNLAAQTMPSIDPDDLPAWKQYWNEFANQAPKIDEIIIKIQALKDAGKLDEQSEVSLLGPGIYAEIGRMSDKMFNRMIKQIGNTEDALVQFLKSQREIDKKGIFKDELIDTIGQVGSAISSAGGKFTKFGKVVQTAARIAQIAMAGMNPVLTAVQIAIEALTTAFGLFGDKGEEELHGMAKVIDEIKEASNEWIDELTDRFLEFVKEGKFALDEFLQYITDEIATIATRELVITPIVQGLGDLIGMKNGGAFSNGNIQAYGKGAVVQSPTFFKTNSGLGVMAENDDEAIMPLKRLSSGRLGVESSGAGSVVNIYDQRSGGAPVSVTERMTPNGRQIDVLIRDTINSIITGGGVDRAMSLRYGVAAKGY